MPQNPFFRGAFEQVLVDIRSHLGFHTPLFSRFLSLLGQVCSTTNSRPLDEIILNIADLLRECPVALYQLNSLFHPFARLEFDVRHSPITTLVLKTSSTSRMVTLDPAHDLRFGFNDLSPPRLRDILTLHVSGDPIYDYLHKLSDPALQGCLAQLAQDALDEPDLPKDHRKELLKFLRRPGAVPPSLLLYDLEEQDLFVCTLLSDIYNGTLAGRKVIIKKPRIRKNLLHNSEIIRELILCRQLHHPNIISFLGASFDERTHQFGLVTPYMKYGNIIDFLKQYPNTGRLTPIWQIIKGLEFLHEEFTPPIAHRDIKGANILVGDNLVCCLSDFGLSSIPELSQRSRNLDPVGTYPWMAPELLQPPEQNKVDLLKADIYALGITIFEIYTGKPPLAGCHFPAIFKARVTRKEKPLLPPSCPHRLPPDFLWELVRMMWDDDPSRRPSTRMIREGFEDNFLFPKEIKIDNGDRSFVPGALHLPPDEEPIQDIAKRWITKEWQAIDHGVKKHVEIVNDRINHQRATPDRTTQVARPSHDTPLRKAPRRAMTHVPRTMSPLSSDLERVRGLATPVTPSMRASAPLSPAVPVQQLPDRGPEAEFFNPMTTTKTISSPLTPPYTPRSVFALVQPRPMRPTPLIQETYHPRDLTRLIIPREDICRPRVTVPLHLALHESQDSPTPTSPSTPKRSHWSHSDHGDGDEQENVMLSQVQKFQEEQTSRDLRSPSPSKRRRRHDNSRPSSEVSGFRS